MKRIVFFCFFLVLFYACSSSSENASKKGSISFKLHQLGEGSSPVQGGYISGLILITSISGDTVQYVPEYPYFIKLENTAMDSVFCQLKVDDSVSFIMDKKFLADRFKFYNLIHSKEAKLIFGFKLQAIYTSMGEFLDGQQKLLSLREIKEQEKMAKLVKKLDANFIEKEGIYIKKLSSTEGDSLEYGDEVSLHYKGMFLDGYVFDNTWEKGVAPSFTFGREYQLIEGIHLGLIGLKEGESVKIILPSRRAFGNEGSLAGIVPPFTAVQYEIKLIKVLKKQ